MPIYSATQRELYHKAAPAARSRALARPRGFGGAVAAGAALLLALSSLAIGARTTIVRFAPILGPAYAAAGIPAIPRGPVLEKVSSSLAEEAGGPVLAVEGEIANPDQAAVALASLRVSVEGLDGREIYHWTTPPPKPRLAPGETISFRARLASPPPDAHSVSLRFAEPGDDSWLPPR